MVEDFIYKMYSDFLTQEDLFYKEALGKHIGRKPSEKDFTECSLIHVEGDMLTIKFYHKGVYLGKSVRTIDLENNILKTEFIPA